MATGDKMNAEFYLNLQVPAPLKGFAVGMALWAMGVVALWVPGLGV